MHITELDALRRHWHAVATAADVTSGPLAVRLLGEELVVWRSDGQLQAARRWCPHRGFDLACATVEGTTLRCPYHGWRFGPDGRAVEVPQLGDGSPIPARAELAVAHACERYGLVWVSLEEPVGDVPAFPEADDPAWRLIPERAVTWNASAFRVVDNALDVGHVPVVHAGSIGDPTTRAIDRYQVQETETGPWAHLTVQAQNVEAQSRTTGEATTTRDISMGLLGPLTFRADIVYAGGATHVIFVTVAPTDDQTCFLVQLVARNDSEADAPAAELIEVDGRVIEEDRWACERTNPEFSLHLPDEVHLPCDRLSVAYRRHLAALR